jgi:RNA polymerase sigma factor (sigma-70 family)
MAELYQVHSGWALRLAFVLTGDEEFAQDLTQEAFVRVFGRFGERRDPHSFERYLRTTMLNLARSMWRKRAAERAYIRRHIQESRDLVTADPIERQTVWSALLLLPHRQRAALYLRYYEDLSEQQVADALELSLSAARSLLLRARKKLESEWEDARHG